MRHFGDITKIHGYEMPIVDVVTGGSPCQDLSVAGKRAGLAGERSGLFMEQIRIIKEMRDYDRANGRADEHIRPRYMVWENVCGAFSSNKGEDFRAVLEETAKVADEVAVIPGPPKGKWQPSGCILGDGWSIAWRVHDAQFWGVPQRRKRIALVADFGGGTAPEILFEREGVSGDFEACGKEGEAVAADAGAGIEEAGRTYDVRISSDGTKNWRAHAYETNISRSLDTGGQDPDSNHGGIIVLNDQGGSQMSVSEDVAGTLRAQEHGHQPIVYGIGGYNSEGMKSSNPHSGIYEAETARTLDLNGGSPTCNQGGMAVVCIEGNGSRPSHKGDGYVESDVMYTLNATEHHAVCVENHPTDGRVKIVEDNVVQTLTSRMGTGGGNVPMVMETYHCTFEQDKVQTLKARDFKDPQIVAYGIDRAAFNQGQNAKYDFPIDEEKSSTLVARGPGAVFNYVVRRLTPLECTRLQGYPDGWLDIGDWMDSNGKVHKDSDSPKYKALGNSIALPFWQWMAKRMVSYLGGNSTMASLFDGIGGFPLVFSRVGCKPVWRSEIEEFPMAVTRKRFGDSTEG